MVKLWVFWHMVFFYSWVFWNLGVLKGWVFRSLVFWQLRSFFLGPFEIGSFEFWVFCINSSVLASKGLVNYYINIKFLFFFHDRFNVLRFQLVGEKLWRKDFRLFFRIISERFFSHNVLELNGKVHSRKTSIYEQGILFKFLNFSGKKQLDA